MELFVLLLELIEWFVNKVIQKIKRKIFPYRLSRIKSKINQEFQVKEAELANRAAVTSNEYEIESR